MGKDILITGVPLKQQEQKAKKILKEQVIPKEKKFQQRKREGSLSRELLEALKENA